jgi:DNA-binding response OmpR family regulator
MPNARILGRELRWPSGELHIGPSHARIIQRLARQNGECVPRDAIKGAMWVGREWGTDDVLDVQICKLRRLLLDARAPIWIATQHGVGYRCAGVEVVA